MAIRIMHVLHGLGFGGMEIGLLRLIARLDPERFEHTICTVYAPANPDLAGDIRLITLNRDPGGRHVLVLELARLFLRERPDIVNSCNWGAIEAIPAARLARVPVAVHAEHGRDIGTKDQLPSRQKLIRRVCFSLADRVFTVSEELRTYYLVQTGVSSDRIGVIRNGIDTAKFAPNAAARSAMRARLGISGSTVLAGCVARLDPVKDHATLLHAAERVIESGIDLVVCLVGDGPERAKLEGVVAEKPALRGRVVFAGEVRNIPDWLNAFDVFVLPSLSEAMSYTIIEAMATRLPVLATAVGGNPELIEHGCTGVLVPARDEDALAAQLRSLATQPELASRLGEAARARVEKEFSLDAMVRAYTELYTQELERKRPRALAAGVKR